MGGGRDKLGLFAAEVNSTGSGSGFSKAAPPTGCTAGWAVCHGRQDGGSRGKLGVLAKQVARIGFFVVRALRTKR